MQRKNNIPIALILSGTVAIGAVTTATHITNNIKKDLNDANKRIEKLEIENSEYEKQIGELNEDLKLSIQETLALESGNGELLKRIESLEKELEEKVFPTQSVKGRSVGIPIEMTMTFYGDFAHENGGYAGIDCNGDKLVAGTVASNYYPQGTQFEFNGQIYTVRDRGGSNFNSPNRLDVFVPRLKNESDSSYSARIREYGRRTVTMYKR